MKIGFIGPFGDTNFGDYAMLINDILEIGCHNICLFSYDEGSVRNLKEVYLRDYEVKIYCPIIEDLYIPKESNNYTVEYDDNIVSPDEMIKRIKNAKEIRSVLSQVDCLVVCGGGYFNQLWCARHRKAKLMSIMGTILMADEMGITSVFLGNTYGPFQNSSEFFKNFFASLKYSVLASRDDVLSISNMRDIGVSQNIYLLPDDLYFINTNIDMSKMECGHLPSKYLILELYPSISEINENMGNILNFCTKMKQQYGLDTVFLPLDRRYGGEYQAELLKEGISDLNYINFGNSPFRKIEDTINIVRGAEFVLCQRYHMAVIALAQNVPYMHALKDVCGGKEYYYTKSKGILNQVFNNQSIQDKYFMAEDILIALNIVSMSYDAICNYQKTLFNKKKKLAEIEMKNQRNKYIEQYIRKQMI